MRTASSTSAECAPQACELFLQRSTFLLGLAPRNRLDGGFFLSLTPRGLDLLSAEEGNAGRGVREAQPAPFGAEEDAEGAAQSSRASQT